jgi:hypothetical protein
MSSGIRGSGEVLIRFGSFFALQRNRNASHYHPRILALASVSFLTGYRESQPSCEGQFFVFCLAYILTPLVEVPHPHSSKLLSFAGGGVTPCVLFFFFATGGVYHRGVSTYGWAGTCCVG